VINNISPFESPYGTISINATVLGSVSSLPVYHGVLGENDSIDLHLQPIFGERQNVTTTEEAPEAAKKAMEPYGGLPSDAVYGGASTSYVETNNYTLDKVIKREPVFTTVSYSQNINGLWVVGDSNSIKLTLGTKGKLLWLFKFWSNYTYTGDTPIIPVSTAFEKLHQGDVLNQPDVKDENITIDSASPGYYAITLENNDSVLEPIWMLFGNTDHGSRIAYYVYARKFANFTASPSVASPSEEIMFSDMSDTSPTRWYWDFGDGTNSILRNPTHTYQKPGNYTITLMVWNNIGSDTLIEPNFIKVLPAGAPASGSGQTVSTTNSETSVRNG
jgi:PKD repeat protein